LYNFSPSLGTKVDRMTFFDCGKIPSKFLRRFSLGLGTKVVGVIFFGYKNSILSSCAGGLEPILMLRFLFD